MKYLSLLLVTAFVGLATMTTGCEKSNEVTVNQPKEVKTKEQVLAEIAATDLENEKLTEQRKDDD
ncbi:hypothetical protein CA13_02360 [Planctomycetes bacterium CA13]|uniref:Uncharacterized protein n=1 Tax=Novipirellula herctigrandis TaxID=2527986 RepID=A0A5C5YUW7_9BACT|nr:hypothetical protein CA13_02360 [Planctomycetes bacterium CA13]